MKKIILLLIMSITLNAAGLSLPFGFLTDLNKIIQVKDSVVIITKENSELIVPTHNVRIMNDGTTMPSIAKYKLIITDYILFNESKILYITQEQYLYLKQMLYNI